MARKIVVTSGKGGVGKTTVTANLGIALAKMALRVVIVDFDFTLNNLDIAVEAENNIVFDMFDVAENKCRIKQALVQNKTLPSLFLLPSVAGKGNMSECAVKTIVSKLDEMFDYVLIDCPAGIEEGFERSAKFCDEAIIVCTPHLASLRDADKVAAALIKYCLNDVKVVINRMRGDLVAEGKMLDAFEVFSLLNANPLGIIEEDDTINCTGYVEPNDNTFDILANNLHNGATDMIDYLSKHKSLLKRKAR